MKKKVLKVVAGASLMIAMAIGVQMNKVQTTNTDLCSIINDAYAGCETVSGLKCKQVWCSSTYTYGGCGSGGNGNDCSTSKSC